MAGVSNTAPLHEPWVFGSEVDARNDAAHGERRDIRREGNGGAAVNVRRGNRARRTQQAGASLVESHPITLLEALEDAVYWVKQQANRALHGHDKDKAVRSAIRAEHGKPPAMARQKVDGQGAAGGD